MSDLQNPQTHPRCECHDCVQQRVREQNPFRTYFDPHENKPCGAACCQPGYAGYCFCDHGRVVIS